jgi:hypothetical protein
MPLKALGFKSERVRIDTDDTILCGADSVPTCGRPATRIFLNQYFNKTNSQYILDVESSNPLADHVIFRCDKHARALSNGWDEISYDDWTVMLVHGS